MASGKKIGRPLGSKDGPKDPNTGPRGRPRLHVEEGVFIAFSVVIIAITILHIRY